MGIVQLTDYTAPYESVSRLKALRVGDDKTMLYWELWSASEYTATQYMMVDDDGDIVVPVRTLSYELRLPRTDEPPMVQDNKAVFYAGSEGLLARYELCLGTGDMSPTPSPTPSPSFSPSPTTCNQPTRITRSK